MDDKSVTLIISDLHVGGGAKDEGDDHVSDKNQLRNFIEEQGRSPEGLKGDIELIINGDFLEFAQVEPQVYKLGSSEYWCSEAESLQKLKSILTGHADIFEAFKKFQQPGNRVTLGAGNHDVDLYWPEVQKELRRVGGDIEFETGSVWYWRYNGQLQIGHGHMFDPANKFERWNDPIIRKAKGGIDRLEMCPGTFFMVQFVNWLEKKYPFADNLRPVTALGRILWGEQRFGLAVVAWMFARFVMRHPNITAGIDAMSEELGKELIKKIEYDDRFAAEVTGLYRQVRDASATVEAVRLNLNDEESLYTFFEEMLSQVEPDVWTPVFEKAKLNITLGIDEGDGTLAIKEGNKVDKDVLWEFAKKELAKDGGPKIVVMGHTHQPDERQATNGGLYFNPGSWTRYVDYEKNPSLTLEQLGNESTFPYQLNCIRVEKDNASALVAKKITYDEGK
jgi:UDP-2,3-diacylglucosamine pyrophosphatase LpxH